MEAKAWEYLNNGEWNEAVELFSKLLFGKQINKKQAVSYLLARSECFLELNNYEMVISDTQKLLKLLPEFEEIDTKKTANKRLVRALISLKRYEEAEVAVKEWLLLVGCYGESYKIKPLLQHLNSVINSSAASKSQIDAAFTAVEAKLLNGRKEASPNEVSKMETAIKCIYCGITFREKSELRDHCQSESHQNVIMSDEGRDWQWRPPPRGTNNYTLCERWNETESCRYGAQCVEAHGQKELAEWKERFEYRKMKLQRAYEKELYGKSYTEELVEKWVQASSPEMVMREQLNNTECTCSSPPSTTVSSKNSIHEWIFVIKSDKPLQAVALLQDQYRNHFSLSEVKCNSCNKPLELKNNQEWISSTNCCPNNTYENKITVVFKTDIFGTFRQSVVFDFGKLPVLAKHLCVDVIPVTDIEKINEIRKEIILSTSERWDESNSDIIEFTSSLISIEDEWGTKLKSIYPNPQAESFTLSHATVTEKKFTKNNYRARMHELLFIEEMARYELVSKYNLMTKLKIAHSYLLAPNGMANTTAKYSNSGELFALMHLSKDLSEDTLEGRLILNNCQMVLLSPELQKESGQKRKVYEALIEDKGKKMIYLRLSAKTVEDLGLRADTELKTQIQFQLNRVPYCEWHYAVDKVADFKLIFPETYVEPNVPWSPQRQWSDSLDARLNLKQKEAIVAITTPNYVHLPPILIIGPFGTGKTFTLAQAIKEIIKQPDTRVLICTHSNSAADLYIKDYLHPYVEEGHKEATPLRIYYHKRWVATVNPVVQKYCPIESVNGIKRFKIPTIEDITKHRIIVVTLSISIYLSTIGLPQGFFSHILLDEAAQAMECETIMPLAFANEQTRIVLAGDHMQLSPDLFSQFAKERNLQVSLLERLYDHYPASFPCKVLLCENYRAHEAIIQFTSESFYEQKLISSGKQPKHSKYYPLTFFTTRGEDVQDQNSTAFYNNSEVYEVVERVAELRKMWPPSWGKIDDQSIGIMTPYADQVFRIRSELRKRRMGGISVERVLNVQGKQFRAIFLSTVRTRRTCTSEKVSDDVDYGFLSNSKLLNTAITRAQSLVAVVGDPIALCSIGRCSKVWERFIQICNNNKSLFGITWSSLRSQLDGVELKKTYVLNPLAPEFVPRRFQKESYIRCLPFPYSATNNLPQLPPPPPPQIPPNIILNRPILSPYAILPIDPNLLSVMCRLPQSPNMFFPRMPQMYQQWPQNSPEPLKKDIPMNVMLPANPAGIKTTPNNNVVKQTKPSPTLHHTNGQSLNNINGHSLINSNNVQTALHSNAIGLTNSKPPTVEMAMENTNQKPQELIQFLNNVHFPEVPKQPACPPTGQTLNDYINLLPQNMSLADMLFQPHQVQEKWFYHLLETRGIEAAKKFEYLIHTTTKKEMNAQSSLMPNFLQDAPNFNWFDKPANQINFNKPVYLKESESLVPIKSVRQPPSEPLYRRQTPRVSPDDGLTLNGNGEDRLQQHSNWQRQINEEFANMSVDNTDSMSEMLNTFNRDTTYASVLRAPQKPCTTAGRIGQKFNSNPSAERCNGVNNSNGPRLYQYFS